MRALQLGFLGSAILASCFFTVTASADFCTDFENYSGLPSGFPLSPQFGWYVPNVAGSLDMNVYTYFTGNPLGIPDNPTGGLFWVGGRGPGSSTFCRAQHDITFSNTLWELALDFCANFNGTAATNNVGSFSGQPAPNDWIMLCSWVVGSEGSLFNLGYIVYDAAGVQVAQPGNFAGPAWQGLPVRNWYRLAMKLNFATNLVTEVSIANITNGGPTTTVNPVGWYLEGGAGGSTAPETAFRFFAGATANEGCITAWDNPCFRELGTTAVEQTTWGSIKGQFDAPAPGSGKAVPQVANPEVQ